MSWKDRLRECVYTSPAGSSFTLLFDEVSREVGKKAPVTEFPGQDSGAVQDLGQATKRYPLTVYLGGADYDTEADRFWEALNESGPGRLSHPRFGDIAVVPISVQQTEQFVDGAGRATFTIQFVEAIDARLEFPAGIALNADAITAQVDTAIADAVATIADIEIEEPGALAQLGAALTNAVDNVSAVFDAVTGFTDDVRSAIDGAVRDVLAQVDELVAAPARMVQSLAALYRLPARTIMSVKAKVAGYVALAELLADQFISTTAEYAELFGLINDSNNNSIAAATAEASVTGEQETSSDAADTNDLLATLTPAGDDFAATSSVVRALSLAQQAQWDAITQLPIEQQLTLEYDETLIQLIDRLYTDIDDLDATIEQFITFNSLQGADILVVTAGTTVRWYER